MCASHCAECGRGQPRSRKRLVTLTGLLQGMLGGEWLLDLLKRYNENMGK